MILNTTTYFTSHETNDVTGHIDSAMPFGNALVWVLAEGGAISGDQMGPVRVDTLGFGHAEMFRYNYFASMKQWESLEAVEYITVLNTRDQPRAE